MPYNPNIPQPTDKLQDSQPEILDNFQEIDSVFDSNHYTFGTANQGKHRFIELPVQAAAPVIPAGEVALYNLLNIYTSNNELTVKRQNGTSTAITAGPTTAPGWFYTPNGLLVKFGVLTTGVGNTAFSFPVGAAIPAFTTVLIASITPVSLLTDDKTATFISFTTTVLNVCGRRLSSFNTGVACTFHYVVIGT